MIMRTFRISAILLMTVLPATAMAATTKEEPVTLRVMSFNVWYGGEQVSLDKVGEAIRSANPDIVGLQEADRNLSRIAALAGMPYVDTRRRLLSRWPIFDSGSGERSEHGVSPYSTTGLDRDALHAWVMVRPGKVVAVTNVHLSSSPSGLGAARQGGAAADVLAIENSIRVPEAKPLAVLAEVGADGTPVFLTGDFNTASHLDWTAGVVPVRSDVPFVLDWPAMRLLAEAGLRDSYREIYPDPVMRPGFTWTPGAPHPLQYSERGRDRIDYILTAGATKTMASEIVGEPGGPDVDIVISPWPSDHRAVVSTFEVQPADAPPLISVTPRRVEEGDPILVRTWDPLGKTWTVQVTPRGGKPGDALASVAEMPHDYQRAIPLSTLGFPAGDYDAVLINEDGEVLKRNGFTVAARGALPQISAVESTVRSGAPVAVRWRGAPGDLRDWVGIYAKNDTDITHYLGFVYTEASFNGEAVIAPESGQPPLAPGEYELRLMHDETYVTLAKADFTVTP